MHSVFNKKMLKIIPLAIFCKHSHDTLFAATVLLCLSIVTLFLLVKVVGRCKKPELMKKNPNNCHDVGDYFLVGGLSASILLTTKKNT